MFSGEISVKPLVSLAVKGCCQYRSNLFGRRPDLPQIHRLTGIVIPQRLLRQVERHPPGQGKGNDQRRTHQKVGFDIGMHPRLEVAVAGKHTGRHQAVRGDGFLDGRIERT